MQQNITDPSQRFCYRCDHPASVSDEVCPLCGGALRTRENIRTLGCVLILLGGIASAVTLWIFTKVDPAKINAGGKASFAVGILVAVFAIGVSIAIAGLWQMIFGRRNKWIVWFAIALVGIVVVATEIFGRSLE